jgi:hypothetical protein
LVRSWFHQKTKAPHSRKVTSAVTPCEISRSFHVLDCSAASAMNCRRRLSSTDRRSWRCLALAAFLSLSVLLAYRTQLLANPLNLFLSAGLERFGQRPGRVLKVVQNGTVDPVRGGWLAVPRRGFAPLPSRHRTHEPCPREAPDYPVPAAASTAIQAGVVRPTRCRQDKRSSVGGLVCGGWRRQHDGIVSKHLPGVGVLLGDDVKGEQALIL